VAKAKLKLIQFNKDTSFQDWLPKTSPQYIWDFPHIKEIINRIQPILNGEKKHLMFWLPPQHGKSILVSKHLPAYILERNPANRIILGAYNSRFASDFSRAVKRILVDKKFPYFSGKQLAADWETSKDGFFKSFGMKSGITGNPGDYVFIDDPIKSYLEAFSETTRDNIWQTMVYDIETREQKKASYVVIQTRWHQDDLSGRLLDRDGRIEDGGKWDVLSLPALAEENDPLGRTIGEALCPVLHSRERLLERQKKEPSMFQSLYQQSPTMEGGNLIKIDWFKHYDPNVIKNFDYKVMSVDGAWKPEQENDYSACTTWGVIGDNFYLIDIWRDKVIYPTFKLLIQSIFNKHNPSTILIEDTAAGIPFTQELSNHLPVHPVKPEGNKQVRVSVISDIIQSGRVFIPDDHALLYDFLHEISSFPKGKNDDLVDTLSQVLQYLSKFTSSPLSIF
jgi:predicted phage terminase large subunit-like protein